MAFKNWGFCTLAVHCHIRRPNNNKAAHVTDSKLQLPVAAMKATATKDSKNDIE